MDSPVAQQVNALAAPSITVAAIPQTQGQGTPCLMPCSFSSLIAPKQKGLLPTLLKISNKRGDYADKVHVIQIIY